MTRIVRPGNDLDVLPDAGPPRPPEVCLVIEDRGKVCGYARLTRLFQHRFLEHLWVDPACRRQGFASDLMASVEAEFEGDRLFTSTNESNTAMRTLLAGRGYRVTGVVENLDDGDPELFLVIYRSELDAGIVAVR